MNYERGEIVLTSFPFTDLSKSKVRPALILSFSDIYPKDVVIAAISSRPSAILEDTWIPVENTEPYFHQTGLKVSSIIKAEKLALIDPTIIQKKIGKLPQALLAKIDKILCKIWHCL